MTEEKVIRYKKIKELRLKLAKQGEYYAFFIPKDEANGLKWGEEYIVEIYGEVKGDEQ